ncbi:WD40 repeat-like protein [Peniophora sp. CONT]|nr:WD40 repeat-like protein [Peniophora sp. CONT]
MSEQRRQEIAAKRARLDALRAQRVQRQAQAVERRSGAGTPSSPHVNLGRDNVDDILAGILGPEGVGSGSRTPAGNTPPGSVPGTPARGGRASGLGLGFGLGGRGSEAGSSTLVGAGSALGTAVGTAESDAGTRMSVDMIEFEQELFELPVRERVLYNKEIQTAAFDDDDDQHPADAGGVGTSTFGPSLDDIHAKSTMIDEDAALEAESIALDAEIAAAIRELSDDERAHIVSAPEFLDFVEQSSKIVQRALNDGYDYITDYTLGAPSDDAGDGAGRVKRVAAFWDERLLKNRSITDLDWSPKYPELTAAAYNKNAGALNEPDGLVCVWNAHLLARPEFVFQSQSDVLSAAFSPFHPNLIFGGTYAGQILLWDTRARHLPVLKTPLGAAGHTHPVYALSVIGSQNAHNLISASTDGLVCSWLVDMLAQPQESLELVHTGHSKTGEVAITSLAFPDAEHGAFFVGTEEGAVYHAHRHDRAGFKAGLSAADVYRAHGAPVFGLHFHPATGPIDFGDLFLTASADWTVKLWRAQGRTATAPSQGSQVNGGSVGAGGVGKTKGENNVPPLYSFDEADDYVYDVRWHPAHPAVFGAVDGSGRFDVWNLNADTEVPVVSTPASPRALNKLRWDAKDGRRCAVGGSDGKLLVYDIGDMALPRETEWADLQKTLAGLAAPPEDAGLTNGVGGGSLSGGTRGR